MSAAPLTSDAPVLAAAVPVSSRPPDAVSLREKVSYALGDTASNFYWKAFEVFIVFYYTDVFGLSALEVAAMLFVTRLGDAVADPLMGALADRTSTRWGKFRPYLLWCAVPMAVSGVLAFTRPAMSHGMLLVYAYVTYTTMMLAYTAINIPYSALLGVITPNSIERTSISSFRFVGGFTGGLVVQTATLGVVRWLGAGDAPAGWQRTMIVYGVIACALFMVAFAWTRERIAPPAGQRMRLGRDVADLLANRPWCILFGLGMFVIVSFWLRGGASAYYFKYYVKREELIPWFFGTGTVASIVGASVAAPLVRAFGKRRLYATTMALGGLLSCAMFMVGPSNIAAVFAINIAIQLVLGPQAPVVWAMYADTADYAEWTTGRRTTGLVFSTAIFSMKVGGALGGWALATLLDHCGYVPNAEQTAASLQGIVLAMSVIPGVFGFVAAATVLLYDLDEGKVAHIGGELARRRASEGSAKP